MKVEITSVEGLKVKFTFSDLVSSEYRDCVDLTIEKDGENVLSGLRVKAEEIKRLAKSL